MTRLSCNLCRACQPGKGKETGKGKEKVKSESSTVKLGCFLTAPAKED